jgi:kynurenine 3-monooxygenase
MILFGFTQAFTQDYHHCTLSKSRTLSLLYSTSGNMDTGRDPSPPPSLNVAVVGGGPSGLLFSHLLLQQDNTKVTLIESRSDPRAEDLEGRAYALGIGIRGRTAIRQVDEDLWEAVRRRGYESERFQLHIGGLVIPLRSESDGKRSSDDTDIEPSVLTYQTDLCGALLDELERRFQGTGRLDVCFDTKIDSCDLDKMTLIVDPSTDDAIKRKISSKAYDLIVGSDGVNSVVRQAMQKTHPGFQSDKKLLSGEFKVVRLDNAPPNVDPSSVSLLLPRSGSTTAFVEPTGNDGSCCILFAGGNDSPILSETINQTAVLESLQTAFPQWEEMSEEIALELMKQTQRGTAYSVVCNTYHYNNKACLIGDAAHATGGVSGQGVNSALQDSSVLSQCIRNNRDDLASALFSYSVKQVPEGKALYDLSFGPKPSGLKGLIWGFMNARDTLFRGRFGIGRPPLQTRLTTTLTPFSEIRKENDKFYETEFEDNETIQRKLVSLHEQSMQNVNEKLKA